MILACYPLYEDIKLAFSRMSKATYLGATKYGMCSITKVGVDPRQAAADADD